MRGVIALHPSMHDTPTGHAVVIVGHYSRRPNGTLFLLNYNDNYDLVNTLTLLLLPCENVHRDLDPIIQLMVRK